MGYLAYRIPGVWDTWRVGYLAYGIPGVWDTWSVGKIFLTVAVYEEPSRSTTGFPVSFSSTNFRPFSFSKDLTKGHGWW